MISSKPLVSLTVADVMTTGGPEPVLVIPQNISLESAAGILLRGQVSGAPVVDAEGRCVGVLSALDFLRVAETGGTAGLGREVRDCMTVDVVTVSPRVSLTEVARMMVDAHIHRVVVVDAEQRPIGIVTSTDVLAVVAGLQPASL